jgi:hypothetical protein
MILPARIQASLANALLERLQVVPVPLRVETRRQNKILELLSKSTDFESALERDEEEWMPVFPSQPAPTR